MEGFSPDFFYFLILPLIERRKDKAIHVGLDINKILNVKLSITISFQACLGAQKNRLIEMVLLSTHNIYFS